MDRSIPLGGKFSIGLDGLLGLIPGFGDVVGGLVSSFIILQAQRAGIPKATLMRMVANVGIDAAVGSIPLLGDLFDFTFKANTRNLELYRAATRGAHDPKRDLGFLAVLVLILLAVIAIPITILGLLIRSLY